MPNIKPVSDLRNYTEVLRGISVGEPVFLTKNGRGKYVILDMEEYEKLHAQIEATLDEMPGKDSVIFYITSEKKKAVKLNRVSCNADNLERLYRMMGKDNIAVTY